MYNCNLVRETLLAPMLCRSLLLFATTAQGLVLFGGSGVADGVLSRRALVSGVGGTVAAGLAPALPAFANTSPDLAEPTAAFDAAAEKRAEFMKKQKLFKKAWRKELSNLEFATSDEEASAAVQGLIKLIFQNGNEIPEGVRKMDLDQVYKTVQPKLGKEARMDFQKLDRLVQTIVTVKPMGADDGL